MVDGRTRSALIALLALFGACSSPTPKPAPPKAEAPSLELVESQPIETTLDSPLPDAHVVWLQMISRAQKTIDLAQFYASNAPNSRLEPIVQALEAAVKRGVRVRLLAEISFVRVYGDTLDRLQAAGVAVRTLDLSGPTGGILHAKYFVVDDREAYLGSQNFDWRSLEHIEELGARVTDPGVVVDLARIFGEDWARAGSEPPPQLGQSPRTGNVLLVASPKSLLPPGVRWELPALVGMIEAAQKTIRVQLLTYRAGEWTELEAPLLAAAARGVKIELMVADWSKREKTLAGLLRLAAIPNVEVRFVTIPQATVGFIPFARVIHAKLMVVDRAQAWIGTSNWEHDYFYEDRNVGLVIADRAIAASIAAWSDTTWTSGYATRVDPAAQYTAPRID